MNFWTFLFVLFLCSWMALNSDSKAGELLRSILLMIAKKLFGQKEALPEIEKDPGNENP